MRSQYTEGYKIEETDITLNNGGIMTIEKKVPRKVDPPTGIAEAMKTAREVLEEEEDPMKKSHLEYP
jgi:hypothetical protein